MKALLALCVIVFSISCSGTKKIAQNNTDNQGGYLIKEIKAKNSWYIIYAEKQNSLYKIVVKEEEKANINCNKIIVGNCYELNIQARSENVPEIGGVKLKPANSLDVQCYAYDEKTEICIEPEKGIFDLYYTNDLKGLCYKPNLK